MAGVMDIVTQLNTLLKSLHLPFTLLSPTDLTPSLLLLILESILGFRLSIDHSYNDSKRTRQIRIIKVFLGVLEVDVIKRDVGLSRIDPGRLAEGAWDEVCFVAEVLCWIGDLSLPSPSSSTITFLPPLSPLSPLPETLPSSMLFKEDDTDSVHTLITSPRATSSSILPLAPTPPIPPSSLSLSASTSSLDIDRDDDSFRMQHPPIRTKGYINLIDHESEISSFLNSPNQSFNLNLSPTRVPSTPNRTTRSAPNSTHKRTQTQVQTQTRTRTRLRAQTQSQSQSQSQSRTPIRLNQTQSSTQQRHQKYQDLNKLLRTSTSTSTTTTSTNTNTTTAAAAKSPKHNSDYDPRQTLDLLHSRTKIMQDLLSARMNRALTLTSSMSASGSGSGSGLSQKAMFRNDNANV